MTDARVMRICEYCEDDWKRARTSAAREKFVTQARKYQRPVGACCRCGDVVDETSAVLPDVSGHATNPRKRAHLDGPRGTERELAKLRRDQDLVQQQLEMAYRQGNTKAIERLREMERDLDRRVDEVAFEPNARRAPDVYQVLELGNDLAATRLSAERSKTLGGAMTETWKVHPVDLPYEPVAQIQIFQNKDYSWTAWQPGHRGRKYGEMLVMARRQQTPNASDYYVWVLLSDGTPKDEGPYGPKDLESAKTYARISATNGAHDRAVSRGTDPKSPSFEIVRRYRRGTGEKVL